MGAGRRSGAGSDGEDCSCQPSGFSCQLIRKRVLPQKLGAVRWKLEDGNWKLTRISINGTLHRTFLPVVPARRHEALSEGRALLHGEVRDRKAQSPAGSARQAPEGKARRVRIAASRE